MAYYIFTGIQLIGFSFVGLCLFQGIETGDYSRYQLGQFIAGSLLFYTGHFLKQRAA